MNKESCNIVFGTLQQPVGYTKHKSAYTYPTFPIDYDGNRNHKLFENARNGKFSRPEFDYMTFSRLALYGISLLHYESRLRKVLTGTGLAEIDVFAGGNQALSSVYNSFYTYLGCTHTGCVKLSGAAPNIPQPALQERVKAQ